MSRRLIVAFVLVLVVVPAAHAAPRVQVTLGDNDHVLQLEYDVSPSQALTLERERARIDELVTRAKSDFAHRLGYTRERFGQENWKVISNLKVAGVVLKDGSRTVELRISEAAAGMHDEREIPTRIDQEPAAATAEPEPAGESGPALPARARRTGSAG